jgi:fructokinase
MLDAAQHAVRVFDVNLRQKFYTREIVTESLARTTILKLNAEEVVTLGELLGAGRREGEFLRGLMAEYGIKIACVTRGEEGCTLYTARETVSRPAPRTKVVDTVGSGDAFSAGLVVKYLERRPLDGIAEAANLLGSFVAGCRGAMPAVPREVVEKFQSL